MKWFIQAGRFRFSILNLISVSLVLGFIVAWFSRLADDDIDLFFNADSLYLPSVYKDLFIDGNTLKGWEFNPAPNFFPDMLLYFVLAALCGNSFIIASFVFSVIQMAVLLYVMSRIFKILLPEQSSHWHSLIFLLIGFFIMEYQFFTKEYYYSFYILSNAFHTGSFVMAMVCLWISLKYFAKPSAGLLVLLFVIGMLCVISDRLFLLFYTVPTFSVSLFFVKHFKPRQIFVFIGVLLLSAFLGLLGLHLLSQGDYFRIDKPHKLMAFDDIEQSLTIFSEQIGGYLSEFGFKSITIYLSMAAFVAMIFLFFRVRKNGHWQLSYYIGFSTVFSVLVISAPIINGNYTGYDVLRYNIYPFYLMPLNLTVFLAYMVKNETYLRYGKSIGLGVYVCALIMACRAIDTRLLYRYFHYYPDNVRLLDALSEKIDLKCGISGYWEAKPVTMFSKKGVRLYPVFPDLAYQSHVANTQWFYANTFNYLFLKDPVDTNLCRQKFGAVHILNTGLGFSIVKTPDFIFPPSGISPLVSDSLHTK